MKTEHKIIAASVGFGLLFWGIDAILDYQFFYEGTLMGLLLTDVPPHEVYIRCVVFIVALMSGVLASSALAKRKRAEGKVANLNRVLRTIRNVNRLITMEKDRDRLLQGVCDTLTQARGYHTAWMALFDAAGGLVTTAQSGLGQNVVPLRDRLQHGVGIACGKRARSQSAVVVIEDPASTCADCPLATGYAGRSAMTVPLEHGGKAYGLLSVAVPSHVAADDEQAWLREIAGDVAFALHSIELEEERKRGEENLALRYQLWDSLMANTPDLVYFKDADHNLIMASQAYADAVGFELEEVVGKTCAELWPHEAEEIMADERQVLAGEPIIQKEREVTIASGERRWYLLTKVPIYHNGEVIGFFAIDKDITNSKQAERQLAFQSMLLDQIQDKVTATDLDGRVTYVNQAECRAFGKAVDELVGQHVEQYGEDPERGATQQEIIETTRAEGRWRGEVVNITEDGREIILDCRTQLVYDNRGEPVGMVGISTDITQHREMERQLRQQERLAAVGQLAAGIAHDFNNIMATIILYAQMAARSETLPQRDRERMAVIDQQARHAARMIEQILDFSRRSVLERRPLDLLPLLKEQVKLLRRTLPEHIEIEMACGQDDYIVNADPTRMQQMLTNLAVNARDAMPGGGTLRIRLQRIAAERGPSPPLPEAVPHPAASQDGGGDWIRLTVSDTGMGIPADALPHIFEPFFTTKEEGEGSGLGLAQVHGIVGQHGGRVDVETQMGEGTSFTIHLPALEMRPTAPSPSDVAATPQGQGEVVLVVEDEEVVRTALAASLEGLNYRTLEAANGEEALALMEGQADIADVDRASVPDRLPDRTRSMSAASGEQVALVLSDVVMPGMGGLALFRALRERGWRTPVILLTGHPVEKELDELRAQGLSAWLSKPPNIDHLARTVADALRE